jgi:hypothetical protein
VNDSKTKLLRVLLGGTGVGTSAVIAYELIGALKSEPKLLIETLAHWGPWFVIGVIGVVALDRNVSQLIQLGRDNVQAQQRMADAMQQLAEKDDRKSERQDLLMSTIGSQMEKILERFEDFENRFSARAKGADA